jgi:hypothetical protein
MSVGVISPIFNSLKLPLLRALFFSFFVFGWLNMYAQPSIEIVYTSEKPRIDGRLSEALWKNAAKIDEFYQREPDTGQPVSKKTEVYLCYDEHFLYIGFRCYDDPREITAKEMARDVSLGEDDRVQIIFDTFLDQRNGYWFQIGPLGSIGDAVISENGAAFNKEWDGLWEGKAQIHEEGWDAELKIPFKTLKFKAGQSTWGLKIIRHIKRRLESSYWPVANLDTYRFQVSDAGLMTGLHGITQGIGLDINPYGLIGLDHVNGGNGSYPVNAGLDIFYQLTPGLTSALTINTDFAQTEVDSRQINLTRFSLHFPEKRDFFLDGANYFNFGIGGSDTKYAKRMIPFFSRRLGLDGQGNPVPIVWGAKMTGQAGKWNMGLMNIADKRDDQVHNFAVGRVTRNIGEQSIIGVVGTHGDALFDTDNSLVGVDAKLATSKFLQDKNLALILYGLKSTTKGLKGDDLSFGVEASYPNDFLSATIGHLQIQDNFRAGVGFLPRIGINNTYGEVMVGPRPRKWGILQYKLGGEFDFVANTNGSLSTRIIDIVPANIRFLSGEQISFSTSFQHEHLERPFPIYRQDTITSGKYDFQRNTIDMTTAQRRNLWIGMGYAWGSFFDGRREDIRFSFGYKVVVPLFLGMDYLQNNVELTDSRFTARIYRFNANILFSPDMILSNFVQYDSKSMNVGWQSRLRWIMKPGKEIVVVWNSFMMDPIYDERRTINESSVRVKFKYNFRL